MSWANRGSCFWCGEETELDDYELIGEVKVGFCGSKECGSELRKAQRDAYEEAREDAMQRFEENYW